MDLEKSINNTEKSTLSTDANHSSKNSEISDYPQEKKGHFEINEYNYIHGYYTIAWMKNHFDRYVKLILKIKSIFLHIFCVRSKFSKIHSKSKGFSAWNKLLEMFKCHGGKYFVSFSRLFQSTALFEHVFI